MSRRDLLTLPNRTFKLMRFRPSPPLKHPVWSRTPSGGRMGKRAGTSCERLG